MNSVTQNRVGIASGVNNAVARAAGLLAIAVLGIVMVDAFDCALNQRLSRAHLPASTWESLQTQRTKLAAISLQEDLDVSIRHTIESAIDESFVHGFRLIMSIGAMLAIASAVTAFALIGYPDDK
jgi:hypothetical protein